MMTMMMRERERERVIRGMYECETKTAITTMYNAMM
jgi:hypothetical protein